MPNQEEIKKQGDATIEEKKVEEKETKPVEEKKDEIPPKADDKETEKSDDKATSTTEETKETETEETKEDAQVDETGDGNAIPLSEVVLKSDLEAILDQRIGGLNAKIDALIKENADLKEQNEKLTQDLEGSRAETNAVRDKYEVGDFGGMQPKGAGSSGAPKIESWNSYANEKGLK